MATKVEVLIALEAQLRGLNQTITGLQKASRETSKLDSLWKKGIGGAKAIGLGLGITALALSLKRLIVNTVTVGSYMTDLATAVNINVSSFQALVELSTEAGVKSEVLTRALRNVQSRFSAAVDGNMAYSRAFEHLNINMEKFSEASTEEKLELIAKAYVGATNQLQAYRAVSEILGERAGPRLNEVLQKLATQGLAAVEADAAKAGRTMETSTAQAMDLLADFAFKLGRRVRYLTASWLKFISGLDDISMLERAEDTRSLGEALDLLNQKILKLAVDIKKGGHVGAVAARDAKKALVDRIRLQEKLAASIKRDDLSKAAQKEQLLVPIREKLLSLEKQRLDLEDRVSMARAQSSEDLEAIFNKRQARITAELAKEREKANLIENDKRRELTIETLLQNALNKRIGLQLLSLQIEQKKQAELTKSQRLTAREAVAVQSLTTMADGLAGAFVDAAVGSQTFGMAMANVLRQVAIQLLTALVRAILLRAILQAVGIGGAPLDAIAPNIFKAKGKASGGLSSGLVMTGEGGREMIMNAQATRENLGLLTGLNAGGLPSADSFAPPEAGGSAQAAGSRSASGSGGVNVILVDSMREAHRIERNRPNEEFIIQTIRNNKRQVGI